MAIPYIDHRRIFHTSGGNEVFFEASNQDTSNSTLQYFGFISSTGSWIIEKFTIGTNTIIYSFAAGKTRVAYDSQWNAITGAYIGTIDYTTFDNIADNLN